MCHCCLFSFNVATLQRREAVYFCFSFPFSFFRPWENSTFHSLWFSFLFSFRKQSLFTQAFVVNMSLCISSFSYCPFDFVSLVLLLLLFWLLSLSSCIQTFFPFFCAGIAFLPPAHRLRNHLPHVHRAFGEKSSFFSISPASFPSVHIWLLNKQFVIFFLVVTLGVPV